ncbi:MAG TPA: Stp1/IreP family PP2C-type Ser/Thr phosphatase [Stellaceae bacterium]|nr:Stp1/IreP family PP2C-type Ser/Thr phosphatase [Stellaceae bacterium]
MLRGEIEIVELAGQTSIENRYRASRKRDGKAESIILRERFAPAPAVEVEKEAAPEPAPASPPALPAEDPNGPRAKTAELKPAAVQPNGNAANSTPADSAASVTAPPPQSAQTAGNGLESAVEAAATSSAMADAASAEAVAAVATEAPPNVEPDAESTDAGEREYSGKDPGQDLGQDLGEVFGRVLALSQTISHPAFQRATDGFSENGRVYLVYADEKLAPMRRAATKSMAPMSEADAIAAAIQVCQAISFAHRRALRLNDICPESVALAADGRLKLTGLDYVSNDNELQAEPIFNDGYTAPEIYRGKKVDKRADIFSAGALLYTWLTGERIPSESWREEGGPVRFYPPHVVTSRLENVVRRAIAFAPADRWPTIDAFKAELIALGSTVRLRAAAMTDVGRVREHNEDSVLAVEYTRESMVEPAQNSLYVVADGMGGAEAGEIASAIAVETIRGYIEGKLAGAGAAPPAELLAAALEEANLKIIEYVAAHPESRGMGSTGVCALVVPPDAALAWVGDSRGYVMEAGTLRQVTKDHSLVQRLVEIGQISAEEARSHEHKNVITRSLGARASGPAGAEAVALRLKRGDKLMLCSDGLTAHVDDSQIHDILGRHHDPFEAARELIVAANAGGGTDNISVVVVFAS